MPKPAMSSIVKLQPPECSAALTQHSSNRPGGKPQTGASPLTPVFAGNSRSALVPAGNPAGIAATHSPRSAAEGASPRAMAPSAH